MTLCNNYFINYCTNPLPAIGADEAPPTGLSDPPSPDAPDADSTPGAGVPLSAAPGAGLPKTRVFKKY